MRRLKGFLAIENLILWKVGGYMAVEELQKDFISACGICLDNDELVNEFCRLKNLKRPDRRSLIEIQIDNACGYDAGVDFMRQFTEFVREFVYIPLLYQQMNV